LGAGFGSSCIAVSGTSRLDSHVNAPACETAVGQPYRKKRSIYPRRCKLVGGDLQRPATASSRLTWKEKRLPPMVKPCKAVSTMTSVGSSHIKSLGSYTSQHTTVRGKTIKNPSSTDARHLKTGPEIHILLPL